MTAKRTKPLKPEGVLEFLQSHYSNISAMLGSIGRKVGTAVFGCLSISLRLGEYNIGLFFFCLFWNKITVP